MTAMLVVELRERRRAPRWKPEDDRETLALLEDTYDLLDEAEREVIESEGWKSWPDLYDARQARARARARLSRLGRASRPCESWPTTWKRMWSNE